MYDISMSIGENEVSDVRRISPPVKKLIELLLSDEFTDLASRVGLRSALQKASFRPKSTIPRFVAQYLKGY